MKKIIVFISMCVIGLSLVLLCFNLSIKNIINKTISSTFTSSFISNKIENMIFDKIDTISKSDKENIKNEIESSSEINKITTLYIDTLVSDILNNKTSNVDITPEVNSLSTKIISKYNLPLELQNYINEQIKNIDFNNMYPMILESVKDKSKESKPIIEVYNLITNSQTTIILSIIIIINVLLLILLKPLLSIKYLSFSFEISTVLLFISIILINKYSVPLTYGLLGMPITIDINPFIITNVIFLIIGIILDTIYKLIDKKIRS